MERTMGSSAREASDAQLCRVSFFASAVARWVCPIVRRSYSHHRYPFQQGKMRPGTAIELYDRWALNTELDLHREL